MKGGFGAEAGRAQREAAGVLPVGAYSADTLCEFASVCVVCLCMSVCLSVCSMCARALPTVRVVVVVDLSSCVPGVSLQVCLRLVVLFSSVFLFVGVSVCSVLWLLFMACCLPCFWGQPRGRDMKRGHGHMGRGMHVDQLGGVRVGKQNTSVCVCCVLACLRV